MRKLVADSARCTGCGICEKVCSKAFYNVEDREKSAIRVSACDKGDYSIAVCDQCGECIDMCQPMALKTAVSGVVQLNKKKCVGCLICVGECLRDYMYYNDTLPTPFKCVACGMCVAQCPSGVLTVVER